MSKVRRIFDIAKELNISHIEIINFLNTKGGKYTIMSPIPNELYGEILEQFYQEASAVDRLRKEKARLNVVHHNQDNEPHIDTDDIDSDKKVDKAVTEKEIVKEEIVDNVSAKKEEKKEVKNVDSPKEVIVKKSDIKSNIKKEKKPKDKVRKLKKIDISSIADKINTTKKKQDSDSIKTSVSQLSKKTTKRKKNKKEEEIIEDENLKKSFAHDVTWLQSVGINIVVVHGGGPQIEVYLKKFNRFIFWIISFKKIFYISEGMILVDNELFFFSGLAPS